MMRGYVRLRPSNYLEDIGIVRTTAWLCRRMHRFHEPSSMEGSSHVLVYALTEVWIGSLG